MAEPARTQQVGSLGRVGTLGRENWQGNCSSTKADWRLRMAVDVGMVGSGVGQCRQISQRDWQRHAKVSYPTGLYCCVAHRLKQAEEDKGLSGGRGSSGKVGWWLATAEKINLRVVLISTVGLLEAGLPIPLCPLTRMSKHRSSHSYTPTLAPTHSKSSPSLSHNLLPVQKIKSNPNAV